MAGLGMCDMGRREVRLLCFSLAWATGPWIRDFRNGVVSYPHFCSSALLAVYKS